MRVVVTVPGVWVIVKRLLWMEHAIYSDSRRVIRTNEDLRDNPERRSADPTVGTTNCLKTHEQNLRRATWAGSKF